jgi:hypothetical protein
VSRIVIKEFLINAHHHAASAENVKTMDNRYAPHETKDELNL